MIASLLSSRQSPRQFKSAIVKYKLCILMCISWSIVSPARKLSLVGPLPGANVKSYAGYLTVNKKYNSNLYFWFFPAQVQWTYPELRYITVLAHVVVSLKSEGECQLCLKSNVVTWKHWHKRTVSEFRKIQKLKNIYKLNHYNLKIK